MRPVSRQPNFRPNAQPSFTRVTGPRPASDGSFSVRFITAHLGDGRESFVPVAQP